MQAVKALTRLHASAGLSGRVCAAQQCDKFQNFKRNGLAGVADSSALQYFIIDKFTFSLVSICIMMVY